jgi:hypothetical protein
LNAVTSSSLISLLAEFVGPTDTYHHL